MTKWDILLILTLAACVPGTRSDSDHTPDRDSLEFKRETGNDTVELNAEDKKIIEDFKVRRAFFSDKLIEEKMPRKFFTCPSCGFPTLNEKNEYEICPICDWEDDGQDDATANKRLGGPNLFSLTQSRLNIGRELKFLADSLHGQVVTDLNQFFQILDKHDKRMKIAEDTIKDNTDKNDPAWENWRRTRKLIKRELIRN